MNEAKRHKINSWVFIAVYIVLGVVSGVLMDTQITYLDSMESTKFIAANMSTLIGLGTMASSIFILLVPKIGYKKFLLISPLVVMLGIFLTVSSTNGYLVFAAAVMSMYGVCQYDVLLAPFMSAYCSEEKRTKMFSIVMYTNFAGMMCGTFFGGSIIAYRFAKRLGIDYAAAKRMTENISGFTAEMSKSYTLAHKDVLIGYIAFMVLALIPVLFLKEKVEDYRTVTDGKTEKKKIKFSDISNKHILSFLLFIVLIRIGAALITPYFSLFLSKIGIDRATTSNLVSYQYLAMVTFIAASPIAVKKFGRIACLGGLSILSIPFMFIIANGLAFGDHKVMYVGAALFVRSGLMNMAQPVQQSLPMELVSKDLRPAFNGVIFILSGIAQTVTGIVASKTLFAVDSGYTTAYYITSMIYTVAVIVLVVSLFKKYNKPHTEEDEQLVEVTEAIA